MNASTSSAESSPWRCRSSTASYSTTSGTETAISKSPARRGGSSANHAPPRELQAATRTEVSRTTRTRRWYHWQYRGATGRPAGSSPQRAVADRFGHLDDELRAATDSRSRKSAELYRRRAGDVRCLALAAVVIVRDRLLSASQARI